MLPKKSQACEIWQKDKMGSFLDCPQKVWQRKENTFQQDYKAKKKLAHHKA